MLKLSQVDDPHKGTSDVPHSNVPVVTMPLVDDQTSDGTSKTNSRVCMYTYVHMYACTYMHVHMFVPYSGFFKGENFHESIANHENFTLEIFPKK